ncbi:MAG TPA: carboxypeptidase-like regulatory domain-containing protein [Bryobacteraceae bacterium]|nr:carboxypeptidase-like regulatory domain-containing protein [Bryobacteraceae bacterium]
MRALSRIAFGVVAVAGLAAQTQPSTYTIAGTVVDHLSGRPLGGILMSVVPVARDSEPIVMLTGPDGRFSFPHVPAGKYSLSAQRRGGRPRAYLEHGPYSTAIVTGPGLDSEHVSFPLIAPARLAGTVVDSEGDPVPGAQLMLIHQTWLNGFPEFSPIQNAASSQSGAFEFSQLQAARYYIAVQAQPWYAQHADLTTVASQAISSVPPELDVGYAVTYSGDTTDPAAAQPVQVEEGKTANIRITLRAVPAVTLTLKTAGDEQPPPNGSLTVQGLGGMPMQATTSTSSNGHVTQLQAGAPGRYELNANFGSERIRRTIDLTSNTTLELSKDDPLKCTGRVSLDGSGSVPGRAMVLLLVNEGVTYPGRPNPDGSFSFDPVPPGRSQVFLDNAPGLYVKSISLNGVKAAGDFIDIPASGSFDVSVVAARVAVDKLEGVVEHDGKPVPAAMVLLVPDDLSRISLIRRDQSDSDGTFSLPEVAPGRYTVIALDGDSDLAYRDPAVIKPYLGHGQSVTIAPGFSQRLKVELTPRQH